MFTDLINVTVLWNVTNLPDFVKLSCLHALISGRYIGRNAILVTKKRDLLSPRVTNGEKYQVISCRL